MNPRIRLLNTATRRELARYVLYWAQMNRRVEFNHALAFAVQLANEQRLPVLYYEGLTFRYPCANDRMHTFLLEGVPETQRRLKQLGIGYCFYLQRNAGDPNDVLYRLAKDAAAVVTDDYPVFITARNNANVPGRLDIPYYAVDSSCIVPMALLPKREYAAYTIRPKIHRLLNEHLRPVPEIVPLVKFKTQPPAYHTKVSVESIGQLVASCDIDHSVKPSISFQGGRLAAERQLESFLQRRLRCYARDRNEPTAHATSNLSPYLHFGHISSLEVALAVHRHAAEHKLIADEFLEELIVRRELAFNYARHASPPDSFEHLPQWAIDTLARHQSDSRPFCYSREQFEQAATHDELWNATQWEMLLRGKIHGYYRMYWGKKIIEWSRTHQDALETMVYLHDRYALDGRDPNTYTNILWCFGLHDRPWQERAIFGMVRYMNLDGMKRKTNVDGYLREIGQLRLTGVDPFRI